MEPIVQQYIWISNESQVSTDEGLTTDTKRDDLHDLDFFCYMFYDILGLDITNNM